MSERKVCLILASNLNGTIGLNGNIPWNLPDDLGRYKRLTSGNTQIIGRRTHESLQKLRPRAVEARSRKVKEISEAFAADIRATCAREDLTEGPKQRAVAQLEHRRNEAIASLPEIPEVYSLPHRKTIVVSTTMPPVHGNPNLMVARSPVEAIRLYTEHGIGDLYVAGGARLYEDFISSAHIIFWTLVNNDIQGDTRFIMQPCPDTWRVAAQQKMNTPAGDLSHTYLTLKRRAKVLA
jgi:dihydrofolate reductase